MRRCVQAVLFDDPPLPEIGSPQLEFDIILSNGKNVYVKFDRYYLLFSPHVEFFGEGISSTGYRSEFPGEAIRREPDDRVMEWAKEFADRLYEERLVEIEKEARKRRRTKNH